ncbi:MAG: ATP-binding protein [Candidatus Woesearchaeota archaeon]
MGHIGTIGNKQVAFPKAALTKHVAVVGASGSGKTVLCKVLLEEAMAQGIPIIAIDPKGDIGSVAITHPSFDFRPFVSNQKAVRTAQQYAQSSPRFTLQHIQSTIYTPKSTYGKAINVVPNLQVPRVKDEQVYEMLTETTAHALITLAEVKGAKAEKFTAFVTALIKHAWDAKESLDIAKLITYILEPPFQTIGSLQIADFITDKERKQCAAALNVLITSASKQLWAQGEHVDMQRMLQKNQLNVIDLRFCTQFERQYIVEHILQKIVATIFQKGGSPSLKYMLYIDELAGFIPPSPANPPVKKLLEMLIRQARAFGLSVIVATQSPGDIDYKLLGNMATRFIGKLRTPNDIEKVALAMHMAPAQLREEIHDLKTGEFYYHDAQKDIARRMKGRWLVSYHEGPLNKKQIGWINDPQSRPTFAPLVYKEQKNNTPDKQKTKQKDIKSLRKSTKAHKPIPTKDYLSPLQKSIQKYADKSTTKIALYDATVYKPHLRLVIEIKPFKGYTFPLQGPFVFDVTTRLIPIGNYVQHQTFRTYIPKDISIEPPKRNIKEAFSYAIAHAQQEVTTTLYYSVHHNKVSDNRDVIEKANYKVLQLLAQTKLRQLDATIASIDKQHKQQTTQLKKKIREYKQRLTHTKAKRMIKRIFSKVKLQKQTVEMKDIQKRIKLLEKKIVSLDKMRIKKIQTVVRKKERIEDMCYQKAHTHVLHKKYRPTRKEMNITATILLTKKK